MIGIIYNPHSRKGTTKDRIDELLSVLDGRGVEYEYKVSEHPGDSKILAKEMSARCDTLVAAGGDGTVFEVVNGSIDADISYAILPCGSGNDIARSIGVNDKSIEQIADIITGDRTRPFDCSLINDEYIGLQFTSFGMVANIVENVERSKKPSKMLYPISVLKAIITHHPMKYKVIDDDGESEYNADFISVQNVATAGGGIVVKNEVSIDDGYLDFVAVEHKNLIRVIKNSLALAKGRVVEQPNVTTKRIKNIKIVADCKQICCVDGELFNLDHTDISVYPKQIRFKY